MFLLNSVYQVRRSYNIDSILFLLTSDRIKHFVRFMVFIYTGLILSLMQNNRSINRRERETERQTGSARGRLAKTDRWKIRDRDGTGGQTMLWRRANNTLYIVVFKKKWNTNIWICAAKKFIFDRLLYRIFLTIYVRPIIKSYYLCIMLSFNIFPS